MPFPCILWNSVADPAGDASALPRAWIAGFVSLWTVPLDRDIRPLAEDDLDELGRFLSAGFHASPDDDFAAPDVLRWKYLEGAPAQSLVARDGAGRIVGHLGACLTAFEGGPLAAAAQGKRIATMHIIDWLGSPEHRALGTGLMRRIHQAAPTQFGLGVSPSALVVGERAGYVLRALVPVYARTLRPSYWLRAEEGGHARRAARCARSFAENALRRPKRPAVPLELRRVEMFGPEIRTIAERAGAYASFTERTPERLNAFLRFPRQAMSGWYFLDRETGAVRGHALLNLVPQDRGRTRVGKIVDCLLDNDSPEAWHAAFFALTAELKRQGADRALAYASVPRAVEALRNCGHATRYSVKFHVRDRGGLVPSDARFYLTPLEGDYAYT